MAGSKRSGLGRGLGSLFGDLAFDPDVVSIMETDIPAKSGAPKAEPAPAKAGKKSSSAGAGKAASAAKRSGTASKKAGAVGKNAAEKTAETVVFISLDDIKPNSKQPRKTFSEDALEELAASIRENGVIQPVLLRPAAVGYELVAGERRARAARKAGLRQIPAIVRDLDDRQNSYFALIENMQREDLNSIEEAEGIAGLMAEYGLTQEQAASAVGKSRPYVANALRLLKLPEKIRVMIAEKRLTAGHARAIAGLPTEALQLEAAEKAAKEGWSVRRIESYTGSASKKKASRRRAKPGRDAQIKDMEERLSSAVGTRVRINGSEKRGKLELEYYSRGELERLLELLLQE